MAARLLVLASTSEARRRLIGRLGHEVTAVAPTCDENTLVARTPDDTALLRAFAKADSVRSLFPKTAWIIGSDQLVDLEGRILGKPGTTERARAQLAELSGRTHRLVTAVVVLGPPVSSGGPGRESRIVVSRTDIKPVIFFQISQIIFSNNRTFNQLFRAAIGDLADQHTL